MNSYVSALELNYTNPYVVAVGVPASSEPGLLWKIAGETGTEIVGQLANGFVQPDQDCTRGGSGDAKSKRGMVSGSRNDEYDDPDVVLVGTAVSKVGQHIFAIGTP
ncbi:hypothetical protein BaRGS_00039041 [Batillaria attramentaria]